MKKVLLALTLVALVATSASASFLGGRWGAGAEFSPWDAQYVNENFLYNSYVPFEAKNQIVPFISYDPDMLPALQLRLGLFTNQLKTGLNTNSEGDPRVNDSNSEISIAGLYRLWSGDVAPYVGAKIGVINQFYSPFSYWNYNSGTNSAWENLNTVYGKIIVGAEWKVARMASILFNWDLLTSSTSMWKMPNPDYNGGNGITETFSEGSLFGAASIGLLVYLN